MNLRHLLAEAVALGGGNLCASGHAWEADGGARACNMSAELMPEFRRERCEGSQPVFRCSRCGELDYGERGGPGWLFCAEECGR